MLRYARVVELLSDLVAAVVVGEDDEPVSLPLEVVDALGDDRLTTTMAKMRARSVARRVSRALAAAGVAETSVESGLTNTQPLVAWFCPVDRGAWGLRAGWQLQGDQFRLAIITPHLDGRSVKARERRFEFAQLHADLFDFAPVDVTLGTDTVPVRPTPTPAKPHGFNRYDPDFVYRYKPKPDLTVSQLVRAALILAGRD